MRSNLSPKAPRKNKITMEPMQTNDIPKPYGFRWDGRKLIIILQDGKEEAENTRLGEVRVEIPATYSGFLSPIGDASRRLIDPIPTALRQIQCITCAYLHFLKTGQKFLAEKTIEHLSSNLEGLRREIERGFDKDYGKWG